ncbi:MAG: amidohydrolase family protein [Rhodobacteraceae bacterium]|nr:amidohydrolase family protein [Paracoccaceae bacterium]
MTVSDLVIRNTRIVTPEGEVAGDLAVAGGRIAALGEGLPAGREEVDGRGLILLPGGIDSHCHIAQRAIAGETPCPDDFTAATRAAAAGGVTTVISHSMCGVAEDPETVLAEYLAQAAGRALVDYSVHLQLGTADPGFLAEGLPRLADQGFTSLKLFTTYAGYALDDAQVLAILDAAARLGLLCLVHAEDDALIRFFRVREAAAGRDGLAVQAAIRPIAVEAEMIRRIGTYAKATGARVHVFHVSGAQAVAALAAAAAQGAAISGETCPHYLTFTADDLERPGFEGAKFIVSPALRTAADQAALWAALAGGALSVWSSDHSPQKRLAQIAAARATGVGPYTAFSGGMPGLQTLLPVLFSEGVMAGRITLRRFVELTAAAPAALFGLGGRKGVLAPGADADLVLWDPEARWTVRQADMLSNVDFTPWEGMAMTGKPVLTVSRGRIVARNGQVDPGAVGHGALLRRGRVQ